MIDLTGKRLGKYRLKKKLGHGGMATVYLARHRGEWLAVKVLSPQLTTDPTFVKRFHREVEIAQSLRHPNILPLRDYGQERGLPYLVTPYVSDGSLHGRLKDESLALGDFLRAMQQTASALDYAHGRGVVHRDVKPANILLDADGQVYLTDFGIAKVMTGTAQLTGSGVVGTPAYMAPEQARGDSLDGRADQYALAIICYQYLVGRPPFQAETPHVLIMRHLLDPVPSACALNPALPDRADAILARGLAKDPTHRFTTVQDFVEVLGETLTETLDTAVSPVVYDLGRGDHGDDATPLRDILAPDRLAMLDIPELREAWDRERQAMEREAYDRDMAYLERLEVERRQAEERQYKAQRMHHIQVVVLIALIMIALGLATAIALTLTGVIPR